MNIFYIIPLAVLVLVGCDQQSKPVASSHITPTAPPVTYKPLLVSGSSIGNVFTLTNRELGGQAINYPSRAGLVNVMEFVIDNPDDTGYVGVEKAYAFGEKNLLIVSTGEYGLSCPATTYALTYDSESESVTGKKVIEGCSENVETLTEGNKLTVKKEGESSIFYNGEVK